MVALDPELEIAASLTDPDALREYHRSGLSTEHFADDACRGYFEFALEYYATHGRLSDAPAMEVMLSEFPDYGNVVAGAAGAAPSYLVSRLKKDFVRRRSQELLRMHVTSLGGDDPVGAVSAIRDGLSRIVESTSSSVHVLEYGKDMAAYRKRLEEKRAERGAPYPFDEMQEWTGGMRDGELIVFVGPPSYGKSLFACKTALEAVRQGVNVYLASLELTVENMAQRIEFMQANSTFVRVPVVQYSRGEGKVPPAQMDKWRAAIYEAQDEIAAMPGKLVIEQPPIEQRSPTALVRACKDRGCDFIIVDQLQFVDKPRRKSLQEEYGAALQEFKQQIMTPADGVRLPLLLLHQMNREGVKEQEKKSGRVGSMTNIAGSAWVEQIADVVWGIGRNREERMNNVMNLATLKARNIEPVGWKLDWDTSYKFQFDIARDEAGMAKRLETW